MNFLPAFHIDIYPWGNFCIPIYWCLVTYALFAYGIMDARIILSKTLVYSSLIALMTSLYLVMVLVMEKWFQGFLGYRSIFATAFTAFLIAILFNPIRSRIQAFVDRALFKATPAELVAQREQLLAEVRKSDQMKAVSTLSAGLAHEIKNPLASIKTFTDYLQTHYDDPEFRAKFQKIVGGEVERINLIVHRLLDFAKPVLPQLAPVEIPRIVDETLEFLGNEFVQHRVEVRRRYGAKPPVLGDAKQLKQVFLNVFLNSLQAMNGRGGLDITTAVEGSEFVVTVSDTGCGIVAKDLPHIFDPFYTTKAGGTGLGLAVVQGIIKEHGGRIEVKSQLGKGTNVILHLPIAV